MESPEAIAPNFVCKENLNFINNEVSQPINFDEILTHIEVQRKKKGLIDSKFVVVCLFLLFMWAIILIVTIGIVVTFVDIGIVMLSDQVFFDVFSPFNLVYTAISWTILFGAGTIFGKPLLSISKRIFALPYHFSSSERLFIYMMNNMNLKRGFVYEITQKTDTWLILYRFPENIEKNEWAEDSFETKYIPTLNRQDQINIIVTYNVNFPL